MSAATGRYRIPALKMPTTPGWDGVAALEMPAATSRNRISALKMPAATGRDGVAALEMPATAGRNRITTLPQYLVIYRSSVDLPGTRE